MTIGIVGYGAYIPQFRIKVEEIAKVWGEEPERIRDGLGVEQKSVPDIDEDSATMAVEAARAALHHAGIESQQVDAIFVGSESKPYAVKPTATIVAEACGCTPNLTVADVEFACKAGTVSIQMCMGLVASGMAKYGLAIGSDTSQGRPSDALEYTSSAGAAAFLIGSSQEEIVAEIEDTFSFTTDTPDFWRRQHEEFPAHGGRFTGDPGYFHHLMGATQGLLHKTGTLASDYDYVVFHQPNGFFPIRAAKLLGIDPAKLKAGLLAPQIGNTYSAASLLGMAAVLDVAKPNERILVTSFGSGAGADSFAIRVTGKIEGKRSRIKPVTGFLRNLIYLNYGEYVKHRRKLKTL